MVKIVSGYFKTEKKVPVTIKLEGGGGEAFMARPLKKYFFLRLPLLQLTCFSFFSSLFFLGRVQGGYTVTQLNN